MPRHRNQRRCSATTSDGRPCPNWARRDSDPASGRPLCNVHAGPIRMPAAADRAAGRACIAITAAGTPCRCWALRDSQELYGRPLCGAHAGHYRLPGPGERRCTATTRSGEQCPHWAIGGTAEQYGRLLCPVHVPQSDPRQTHTRMPEAGERRCTATNLHGERCRRWALLQDEEGRDLCWPHAYPQEHGRIRHGYYMSTPLLGEVEWEAVRMARASGRELEGEIVLTRLLLHMIFAYLTESELPLGQNLNSVRLIIQNVRTVARLLLARKEVEGPEEARERDERELQRIDQELQARGEIGDGDGHPQNETAHPQEPSGVEEEAAALLEASRAEELASEIALVRVLLRRMLHYVNELEEMPTPQLARAAQLIFSGPRAVTNLLQADLALRPTREEVWEVVMDQVLDELGEKWRLEL